MSPTYAILVGAPLDGRRINSWAREVEEGRVGGDKGRDARQDKRAIHLDSRKIRELRPASASQTLSQMSTRQYQTDGNVIDKEE